MRDWLSLIVGNKRPTERIGERDLEFRVFVACVMDGIWAIWNQCKVGGKAVEVDRIVLGARAAASVQIMLFLKEDADVEDNLMDGCILQRVI